MALIPQTTKAIQGVQTEPIITDVIESVLGDSGYVEPFNKKKAESDARQILINHDAGLDNVLGEMVVLMRHAENEQVRMKAIENALTIHGVSLKPQNGETNNQINIVFNGVEDGAKRLDAVFCPQR